jgi:chemotaxis protein methyltransferase CheR
MADGPLDLFSFPAMSSRVYGKLASYLQERLGIKLPPAKRVMLQTRVLKRLKALGLPSYEKYVEYVFSPQGQAEELEHLFDVTTTNKTEFFREIAHFDVLFQKVLPELSEKRECSSDRPFVAWSAGCSTGEEAYSLAIVLEEFAKANSPFAYSILASDISTRVLAVAKKAVYEEEKIAMITYDWRKDYFLRSKDRSRREVRVAPFLRSKVNFFRLNLMDERYSLPAKADVIFCRNVVIYFERRIQLELLHRFARCLHAGGYLFTGHAETFCNMNIPFTPVMPTVYRRAEGPDD